MLARLERFYPQVKRGEEGPLGGNSGHVLAEKKRLGAGTWPTITIAYAQVADPGWIPPWDGYDKPDVNYYNHCGGDGGTPTAIVAIPLPLLRWVRDYYCYCYSGGTTTATAFVAIPPPCLWWWPYYYRYCSSGDTTTAAVAWVESIATAVVRMPLSLLLILGYDYPYSSYCPAITTATASPVVSTATAIVYILPPLLLFSAVELHLPGLLGTMTAAPNG